MYNKAKHKRLMSLSTLCCFLLELFAHLQNVASYVFFIITLVDVHINWLEWLFFLILEGGLLVILIDCIIFLSPFLDVRRMFMLTVF